MRDAFGGARAARRAAVARPVAARAGRAGRGAARALDGAPRPRGSSRSAAIEIQLASLVFYVSLNERLYGGFTPLAVGDEPATGASVGRATTPTACRGSRAVARPRRRAAALGAGARARVPRRLAALALAARAARPARRRPARHRARGVPRARRSARRSGARRGVRRAGARRAAGAGAGGRAAVRGAARRVGAAARAARRVGAGALDAGGERVAASAGGDVGTPRWRRGGRWRRVPARRVGVRATPSWIGAARALGGAPARRVGAGCAGAARCGI